MADEPSPQPPGTIIAGRYEIVRLLGAGAMGAVYQAKQLSMERLVALKVMHPHVAALPGLAPRFHREMKATSRIEHANTVRVFDFGADSDGKLFLAMEFLDGRPLSKLLAAEGPLPVERIVHIGRQIARALGAAHAESITHRDLKPDNVMMIDRYGEHDQVKVVDFGIARFTDEAGTKMTAEGSLIGTPAYMSPEQAMGRVVDGRSDFYSLGVILYEMAVGRLPFNGDTLAAVLVAHATEAPPPPSSIAPVSPALEQLILQLLAKNPDERPQSAGDLVQRLDACVGRAPTADMPVTAKSPTGNLAVAATGAAGAHGASAIGARATGGAAKNANAAATNASAAATNANAAATNANAANDGVAAPKRSGAWIAVAAIAAVGAVAIVVGVARRHTLDKGGTSGANENADDGSRARLDAVFAAAGDPLAPQNCRATQPALVNRLARAATWLQDATLGTPRPQDRDALQLLAPAGDGDASAEYWALLSRAKNAVEPDGAGALQAAQTAIARCRDYALAHTLAGNAQQRARDFAAATSEYQAALTLAPEYVAPRFNLGLIALRNNDAAAALADFDAVLARDPAHPKARVPRGQALLMLGRNKEAEEDLEQAALRHREDARAWLLLGEAREKSGAHKTAVEAWCAAKKLGDATAAKLCDH